MGTFFTQTKEPGENYCGLLCKSNFDVEISFKISRLLVANLEILSILKINNLARENFATRRSWFVNDGSNKAVDDDTEQGDSVVELFV